MPVKFRTESNFSKQKGEYNYYDWRIFVDESEEVLNKIDKVVYFLHSSYPNPVRTASDPNSKFEVKSRGWGNFNFRIEIFYKNGRTEKQNYRLELV